MWGTAFAAVKLFFGSSPLGRAIAANWWKIAIIVALAIATFLAFHHYQSVLADLEKAKVTISDQATTIKTQKDQIFTLNDQLVKNEKSKKITDQAEVDTHVAEVKVQTKYVTVIKTVHDQVRVIEKDPTLSEPQKEAKVSQVYVDTLWRNYCPMAGTPNATCQDYQDPAPATATPTPTASEQSADPPTVVAAVDDPEFETVHT